VFNPSRERIIKMTTETKFVEGDFVQLKAGGPVMNVMTTTEKTSDCIWFDRNDGCNHYNFPNSVLVKIDENEIDEFGNAAVVEDDL
jgi:uncharacterized protein YodC (DUF2158 family)